jgi:protein-disulfide isomerase
MPISRQFPEVPFVSRRPHVCFLAALLVASAWFSAPVAGQQTDSGSPAASERQRLRDEITREVLDELLEGDLLRQQIEAGIKDYLNKQELAKAAAAAERARQANERFRSVRPVSAARDHIFGDPDAPISLIEYSDYECPFCKRFHATPREIVLASAGKVNWVYRHLPLGMHNPGAQKQAEAAECANEQGGRDAFWKLTDAIYARTRSGGSGFPLAQLAPLALEIGLDGAAFQQCLATGRFAARVQEDVAEASRLGISGTPTTIMRDNRTGEARARAGAVTAAVVQAEIDLLLQP